METIKLGGGVHFFQEFGTDNFIIEKPHMAFHLGGRKEAIRLVRAILAALGEPVETKPDRSELDKVQPDRWLVVRDDKIVSCHGYMALLDSLIDNLKSGPAGGTIYESRAWVEPRPTERKVVRVP